MEARTRSEATAYGALRVWGVVLNWNGKDDTAACLESLRALRVPADVEWTRLVVDNGSSDGSLEALPKRFPEVRFLAIGENLRWAGGNNRGLALARAEGADLVWLLNNDTVVDPEALGHLVDAVRSRPDGGLFGPTILSWDGAHVWSAGGSWSPWIGWGWHRGLGRAWRDADTGSGASARAGAGASPQAVGYLTGAALLVTRRCLETVGPLDEGYYLYGEDADWCVRARAAGFGCLYVPRAIVRHRVSGSSGAASPFKAYHRTRAGLRLAERHARGAQRLTWPPAFAALLLAQSAAWWVRGGGPAAFGAAWRAWLDHAAGRPPERSAYLPRKEAA
jgi:GT2 family glycosyltransferase